MVLGNQNKDSYVDLVSSGTYDVFTLSNSPDGTNIVSSVSPLISRIRECEFLKTLSTLLDTKIICLQFQEELLIRIAVLGLPEMVVQTHLTIL